MSAKIDRSLAGIKIASPCSARWEEMEGDERIRFCRHCSKNVYNFSALTASQVHHLIQEREGKLCARYYLRVDGTMLTANCPVGVTRVTRRIWTMLASAAAALGISLSTMAAGTPSGPSQVSRFKIKTEQLTVKLRQAIGLPFRSPALMGDIAVPGMRKVVTTSATNSILLNTNRPVKMGEICVDPKK